MDDSLEIIALVGIGIVGAILIRRMLSPAEDGISTTDRLKAQFGEIGKLFGPGGKAVGEKWAEVGSSITKGRNIFGQREDPGQKNAWFNLVRGVR